MIQKKILIFPAGTELANEALNALKYNKYFSTILASSLEPSYANYHHRMVFQLPYVTDSNFSSELNSFIMEHDIDFIIPTHDDVAYKLSKLQNELQSIVIGQSFDVNKVVRFKDITYKYFSNELPIPKIYEEKEQLQYPLFVKPKKGQGSLDAVALNSEIEFECFFQLHAIDSFVVMENLTGEEFTIDCFSDQSEVLYCGPRTREKTIRGISVLSRLVEDKALLTEFREYAEVISQKMKMNGVWFFQMKYDKNGKLKLLEVGPRISGTMMLNRAKGINFIELALFQAMGKKVEICENKVSLSLARTLVPKYVHNIEYQHLYIDFDDTLFLDEKHINSDIMKLIFQAKNHNINIILITKNKKNNLAAALRKFALANIFDDIIHIDVNDKKTNYMKANSLLIDDSFQERKEAIEHGMYAYGLDNMNLLLQD